MERRRLSILHVLPTLEPSSALRQVLALRQQLPADEFYFRAASLEHRGALLSEFDQAGIDIDVTAAGPRLGVLHVWRLNQLLKRHRPDLIHAWGSRAASFATVAARLSGTGRIVHSRRDEDDFAASSLIARWLGVRPVCEIVDRDAERNRLLQARMPATTVAVVPPLLTQMNGTQDATQRSQDREALLRELGLPPDARLIGAVGRLTKSKRLNELLWASDQIHCVRDDVYLLVAGDGPDRALHERYAHLYHIDDHVRFLGWRTDIPRLFAQLDVFCAPEIRRHYSLALLEAMSAGVPVVASDTPAHRELITPEETGYLAPTAVRSEIARWCLKILENDDVAAGLRSAARQRVEALFPPHVAVERYRALYQSLSSETPIRPA